MASSVGGTVRPSILAVWAFMTSGRAGKCYIAERSAVSFLYCAGQGPPHSCNLTTIWLVLEAAGIRHAGRRMAVMDF